ncbi:right-handed parallel beta-helix repeat-containing protein [Tichowtungia aerotolerans]|uniref:Right handed beta helix domain-containing protein n=1 Tax=Tichowtungia aerotolerans TaxID=2697043 RepID=A0A6P1MEB6_9BACT|nr:right-handed parallel beta-helix repeat-containing protein [Tichowtungia aerotolerans]QHI69946.1 hypothetical protein GT409_10945 [Tichowtungia aerotolerans]
MSADELRRHILETRSAPLTNLNVRTVLNVCDFGAVPDDGRDDRPAIAAVVSRARSLKGPVQVRFDPGRYDIQAATESFDDGRRENSAVCLQDCSELLIDGAGAELLIHRPDISVFRIDNSTNLIIRNFTIDYDPLPFSQGTIESVDAASGSFILKLNDGFPRPDAPFFKSCDSWGMLKDATRPGRLKANCPSFFVYQDIVSIDDEHFRMVLKNAAQIRSFAVGDSFAIVGRSASIGLYQDSDNITFDHITAYACPSPVFIGEETSRLNVLNCRMELKGNRLLSNGGGGVICQASRIGPWVENCDFEGLSDDCLNIYGLPIYILEQLSPTALRVYAKAAIHAGDRLVFFNPDEGKVIQDTTVISFFDNTLVVSDPVGSLNIVPPGTERPRGDPRAWKIYDHAYNLNAVGNYYVYRNNVMHDGRRFGTLLRASQGLIENNRFEGLSHSGICIENEPGWPEGFWAQNLIVSSNRITECGYIGSNPSVRIAGLKLNGIMDAPIQKNIYILDNKFHAVSGPAADLNGVEGLVIERNVFGSESATGPLVVGENITGLSIRGNAGESRFRFQ